MLTTAVPNNGPYCSYTVRRALYDRLSQQQLSPVSRLEIDACLTP